MIFCTKLQKEAEGLEHPPFPGPLGEKIHQNISKEAWEDWQVKQTMLINEKRLILSNPQARSYLTQQMKAYLFAEKQTDA